MEKLPCNIYQYSDMAKCENCGLCWDMNDPCEPECKMYNDQRHENERTPRHAIKALVFVIAIILLVVFLCN